MVMGVDDPQVWIERSFVRTRTHLQASQLGDLREFGRELLRQPQLERVERQRDEAVIADERDQLDEPTLVELQTRGFVQRGFDPPSREQRRGDVVDERLV